MDDIAEWRGRIDAIDEELVRLLNERATCALSIGQAKAATNRQICDPERERQVIEHVCAVNQGPLSNTALERLFRHLITECITLEETC